MKFFNTINFNSIELVITNNDFKKGIESLGSKIKAITQAIFNQLGNFFGSLPKNLKDLAVKLVDFCDRLLLESFFVSLVSVLIISSVGFFSSKDNFVENFSCVAKAPIVEEILFRGLFQPGIGLLQKGNNRIKLWFGNETSKKDLVSQEKFRVYTTAAIFGLAHLTNLNKSLFQVVHSFHGGLAYGYLKEKTDSIAPSIIFHAANNAISCLVSKFKLGSNSSIELVIPLLAISSAILLDRVIYKWATKNSESSEFINQSN